MIEEIQHFIGSQPEPKRSELQQLHELVLQFFPKGKLWFLDGKDETGKVVTNPSIGYGSCTTKYADGKIKEFYQIGLSPSKAGISVYIMGFEDKTFLAKAYGNRIGKADVTGYCIRFKTLSDINMDVLTIAIQRSIGSQR